MTSLSRRALKPETNAHPQSRRVGQGRTNLQLTKLTPLLEVAARLGVNGLLVLVSLSSLGQLVPYIYSQVHHLKDVKGAVNAAQASNLQLKLDFSRYFDPAQTGDLIEEQSGYKYINQRPVVWTNSPKP